MRQIFGILLIIAGVVLGFYVGLWVMFVGGIIDIIDAIKADVTSASDVFWGVVKMLFAGIVGSLCAYILVLPGMALVSSNSRRSNISYLRNRKK